MINLHSGLAPSERAGAWVRALRGDADIVLGTRLAIFTPLPRLGLIVADEEHDMSFKQQDSVRYSARDIAIFRAKQANVPVILGSATPSLESYHNAWVGRYRILRLPSRAAKNADLPVIRYIDTRIAKTEEGLSAPVVAALLEMPDGKTAESGFYKPAGLRACAAVQIVCMDGCVPALRKSSGGALEGKHIALPPLRISGAFPDPLSGMRRSGYRAVRTWHAKD